MLENCNHRVNLRDMEACNFHATREVLFQLPSQYQPLVIYHIAGAILTNLVRSKYDMQHELQQCSFCDERDILEHRLFSCPVTEEARRQTLDWMEFQNFQRDKIHCPLMPYHQDATFHRACCFLRELDLQISDTDQAMLFYTDGSMDSVGSGANCAAFAVVCLSDPTEGNIQRWAKNFRESQDMPPFSVACSGKVPGLQTINRAEFLAIIHAIA